MSNSITLRRIFLLTLGCLLGASLSEPGLLEAGQAVAQKPPRSGDDPSPRRSSPERSSQADETSEPAEASEAAALELVRRHLPQLSELLETLRRDAPEQYRRAISDLARQARRLEASRRRDPRLFELELEILKRQTRVDLSVARLQLRDDPKTRHQLRRALEGLQQTRRARLEYERDLLQQRMTRIEQQLQTVEERLDAPPVASSQWVDKTYRKLLRKAGRAADETDGNETETTGSTSR